jgi:protein-tyrosine-phosphatase
MTVEEPIVVGFVCVENAGRSQMAAAFAEREVTARELADEVEVVSGGTTPGEEIHEVVVAALAEVGFDYSDRRPRGIGLDQLKRCDYLVTMGCYIPQFDPRSVATDAREWDLPDPADAELDEVRRIRDEIDRRVVALFDEIESRVDERETDEGAARSLRGILRDVLG